MTHKQTFRQIEPDLTEVALTDFVPDEHEISQESSSVLRKGLLARDTCGDGTNEYKHNEPLVLWKEFPVIYFIDSSIIPKLVPAVVQSANEFNKHANFEILRRTNNPNQAKIRISMEPIDVPGRTLAQARWWYRTSTMEITRATIIFDTNEAWAVLENENCGAFGTIFDLGNVASHEFGHVFALAHAPTDKLQTMYATTSPGKTLGRSLGNGDILGFQKAYKIKPKPKNVDKYGIKKLYKDGKFGMFANFVKGRQDGDSNRWNISSVEDEFPDPENNVNYEVTFIGRVKSQFDGLNLKFWGPHHGSKGIPYPPVDDDRPCCWYDLGIDSGGQIKTQIEKPHPDNFDMENPGPVKRIDSIINKMIGIKWVVYREGNGRRVQLWHDIRLDNNWELLVDKLDKGDWLPAAYSPPKQQEVELRVRDANPDDIEIKHLYIRDIESLGKPENRPPIVRPLGVQVEKNKHINIKLEGHDPDRDQIKYQIVELPNDGQLTTNVHLPPLTVTYIPNHDFTGSDRFRYNAKDEHGAESGLATVNIMVFGREQPPKSKHELTPKEMKEIKTLKMVYENAKKTGDENAIDVARENLQDYVIGRLIEKHTT